LGSHGVVVPTVAVVATMLLVATLQNLGTPGCPSPCGPRSPRRRSSRSSTTTHACRDGSRRFRGRRVPRGGPGGCTWVTSLT